MIIDELKTRAKQAHKKIILPESDDPRILEAAARCVSENLAEIILVGDSDEINRLAAKYHIALNLPAENIINPKTDPRTASLASDLFELRKHKGLDLDAAKNLCLEDPMYFACMYLKNRYADGIVSGANHSTADTLRPALQILKNGLVSAFFLIEVPDCEYGENGVFIYADAGLNQNPDPASLAQIAADSAVSFTKLVCAEPAVALLSHSTHGSATHSDVDKIVEATKIAHERFPELNLDGELQADAALDHRVAALKGIKNSPVAGRANVLIFPDLDAGNIAYKLTQYLAKANAYGPITQGLLAPVNDLSRGCTVDDILGVIAITALQSAA